MNAGLAIILAIVVVFGVVPVAVRFTLKLFEPGIDDEAPRRRWFGRKDAASGEWGRDDAGLIASSKKGADPLLPHQRGRRAGRFR